MTTEVLALDLEHTLIDDANRAWPRPGLFEFLRFCHEHFPRVALFTTVETPDARDVLHHLADKGHVPTEFLHRLEYIEWTGQYKDLKFIPNTSPDRVLLVDDDSGWIRSDQRGRWLPIAPWAGGPDKELQRVQGVLEQWLDAGKIDTQVKSDWSC